MLIEFICDTPNQKILKVLSAKYPDIPYNKLNMLLRKRDIRVNGKRISSNVVVNRGDAVQVYISQIEDPSRKANVKLFYIDDNILIVDKSQDIEIEGKNPLTSELQKEYSYVRPCHRLDRNTGGLVVFALNEKAYNEMAKAFDDRTIEKYYLALCVGTFEEKGKKLEAYLFKDSRKARVYISDKPKKGFVPIITEYRVLEEFDNLSLVHINLITGRTHQIRAHMAHIGHPILGDGKYGRNEANKKYGVNKQQLFAHKLKFNFKKDSPLYYLNSLVFENKLYEKDLLEFRGLSK
ncbi:MAG: RluA family pseudouridine synthase [Clostridiales bacterium]|nr:RluA family pseudouridine synthase [Clostridiales bacterium]